MKTKLESDRLSYGVARRVEIVTKGTVVAYPGDTLEFFLTPELMEARRWVFVALPDGSLLVQPR